MSRGERERYGKGITALTDQIAKLAVAVLFLRSLEEQAPEATVIPPTNTMAIRAILSEAHPGWIGVNQIMAMGPDIGGRTLNNNSVRWVLKEEFDNNRIEKTRANGRASYRTLTPTASESTPQQTGGQDDGNRYEITDGSGASREAVSRGRR